MRRSLLQWCFATLVLALSASADPCDGAHPFNYDVVVTCQRTEGVCTMSSVSASLFNFGDHPEGCATVEWSFGDGSPVVTSNGADTVQHTYAAAGEYTVVGTIRTAGSPFSAERSERVTVANGLLRWTSRQVREGQVADFTVTRTNIDGPVSIPWSLQAPGGAAPSDVVPTSGTLTFAPGQAVATISIATANNVLFTGDRQYELVPGAVSDDFILDNARVQLRIEDDDFSLIKFAERPVRVSEDAGVAVVTLTRTGDLTARVSAEYSVDTFFSAGQRIVETFGTLVFEPGQASRSFNVAIIDDDEFTGTATATIRLDQPTGGARFEANSNSLLVDDDDGGALMVTANPAVFIEEDAGLKTVIVNLTATHPISADFNVALTGVTATLGSDYLPFSSSLFFNGTTATFALRIRGDAVPEPDETLTLTLTQRFGNTVPPLPPITITIANDDVNFTPEQFRVRRGYTQQATLVVGGTSSTPLVVPLTSSRPELLRVPASVTIPAGASRVSFEMEGLEVGTTIRVTAELPTERGGTQKIIGHVYEPQGVTFDPGSVHAYPGQEVPVKIAIDGGSGKMFDLPLAVRDGKIASAPAAVTILPDGTGAFTVKALQTGTTRIDVKKPGSLNDYARLEIVVDEAPETPAIASISPATGPAAGGIAFVAPGSHLTADCTLSFGGVPAAGVTIGADGMLHGVTPPHVPATVDAVLTCGAATFVLTDAFTYLPSPPALASVSPTFGSTAGGTLVRATGTNFQSGCWMFFDGVPATAVEFESTTSMIASVPPRAAAGLVATSIRCGNDEASLPASYAYSSAAESAASIISIDPLIGAPGESVTITGSRFRTDDAVDFDGTPATILRTRPDEHVVRIPELPLGMSSITVTDTAGRLTTTGPIFTIVEPVPPQVTSVSPASTLPGSEVTLHGRGFRPGYSFAVGGQAAQTLSLRFDEVTIRLGDTIAAGAHPVHVLNAAGKVASIGGTVNVGGGGVRIRGAALGCGFTVGGASVLISGEGFEPGAIVTFNGIPAEDVVLVDASQLRATTRPNVTGPAVIAVKNANGDTATATRFTYFSPFDAAGCAPDSRSRSVRH